MYSSANMTKVQWLQGTYIDSVLVIITLIHFCKKNLPKTKEEKQMKNTNIICDIKKQMR